MNDKKQASNIHPSKSKHMFIASAYNLKNKLSDSPILINNKPIPNLDQRNRFSFSFAEKRIRQEALHW